MISKVPLVTLGVLATGLLAFSIVAYPHLPAQIPQHFGIDGTADRWVATSWASWLLLPVLALVIAAFVCGMAAIIPTDLRKLNLPNKEQLLALPADRQLAVIAVVRNAMHWIAVIVFALLSLIQVEVYIVAREPGRATELVVTLAFIAAVPIVVYAMQRRVKSIATEHEADVGTE